MERNFFVNDLTSLDFLIKSVVLKINRDEDVALDIFYKFETLMSKYVSIKNGLEGVDIRLFTGYYRKVLTIAKRLFLLDKLPANELNKLVGYNEIIIDLFNNDTDKIRTSIKNEIEEINNYSSSL